MQIVHIASEFAPIIKAGGLADVVHGLCSELIKQGCNVKVILPLYGFLDKEKLNLKNLNEKFVIFEKNNWHNNIAYQTNIDGIEIIFIEMHHFEKYFSKEHIYGYENDVSRFIYFSRAALEFLLNKKTPIDILHLHDWHTSICPIIVEDILKKHNLKVKATVLTVHNFHYQGKCQTFDLDRIGLNGSKYLTKDSMQDPDSNFSSNLNLLKGGITYCDAITTVSNTYVQELLEKKHTYGLDQEIKHSKEKLFGIMNGLDKKQWDPMQDTALSCNFSLTQNAEDIQSAKNTNKKELLQLLNLKDKKQPFFIFIGRLVKQKGVEILQIAIEHIVKKGGIFALCGKAADIQIQKHFDTLKSTYENTKQTSFNFEYNDILSRQMYSAADFILVPSLFEPCGLVQLIAMRYGTIPIVRKTGGLNDSVQDIEITSGYQNGIVFDKFESKAFIKAIDRAFKLYSENNTEKLTKKIMEIDFGWDVSAKKYLDVYQKILKENSIKF